MALKQLSKQQQEMSSTGRKFDDNNEGHAAGAAGGDAAMAPRHHQMGQQQLRKCLKKNSPSWLSFFFNPMNQKLVDQVSRYVKQPKKLYETKQQFKNDFRTPILMNTRRTCVHTALEKVFQSKNLPTGILQQKKTIQTLTNTGIPQQKKKIQILPQRPLGSAGKKNTPLQQLTSVPTAAIPQNQQPPLTRQQFATFGFTNDNNEPMTLQEFLQQTKSPYEAPWYLEKFKKDNDGTLSDLYIRRCCQFLRLFFDQMPNVTKKVDLVNQYVHASNDKSYLFDAIVDLGVQCLRHQGLKRIDKNLLIRTLKTLISPRLKDATWSKKFLADSSPSIAFLKQYNDSEFLMNLLLIPPKDMGDGVWEDILNLYKSKRPDDYHNTLQKSVLPSIFQLYENNYPAFSRILEHFPESTRSAYSKKHQQNQREKRKRQVQREQKAKREAHIRQKRQVQRVQKAKQKREKIQKFEASCRTLWDAVHSICSNYGIRYSPQTTMAEKLAMMDSEISKSDDYDATQNDSRQLWQHFSTLLQHTYDEFLSLGFINKTLSSNIPEGQFFSIQGGYLPLLSSSSESLTEKLGQFKNSTSLVTPQTQIQVSSFDLRKVLQESDYVFLLKTGTILCALTNNQLTDSLWKKTTPFVYDGGRWIESPHQSQLRVPPVAKMTGIEQKANLQLYKSFQSILFENRLSHKKFNNIGNQFWAKEISTALVGYIGDVLIDVVDQGSTILRTTYTFSRLQLIMNHTAMKEIVKPHWVFMVSLTIIKQGSVQRIGHRNGIIFTNNQFYYIEPNGGRHSAVLDSETEFTKMWSEFLQELQNKIDSLRSDHPTTVAPFLASQHPPLPHDVLFSSSSFATDSFRRLQPHLQSKNVKGEEGGYCVSVTLFMINLFTQNCFRGTQWTAERLTCLFDIYIIISTFSGQLHKDIRGFNVAVMRTLQTLQRLSKLPTSSLSTTPSVPKEFRRRANILPHPMEVNVHIPLGSVLVIVHQIHDVRPGDIVFENSSGQYCMRKVQDIDQGMIRFVNAPDHAVPFTPLFLVVPPSTPQRWGPFLFNIRGTAYWGSQQTCVETSLPSSTSPLILNDTMLMVATRLDHLRPGDLLFTHRSNGQYVLGQVAQGGMDSITVTYGQASKTYSGVYDFMDQTVNLLQPVKNGVRFSTNPRCVQPLSDRSINPRKR